MTAKSRPLEGVNHTLTIEQEHETKTNPRLLSPVTLAFMGDAVYELLVRESLCGKTLPANRLHREAVRQVCAAAQSSAYEQVAQALTEEELAILKRGRNAHTSRVPKNCNPVDYRRATGLEALLGYLYLSGRMDRIRELFELMHQAITSEE